MHCFELQDWVTIRGASGGVTITQSEHTWLDLEDYRDAVLWLEVKEATPSGGAITFLYQTCPTKDEEQFAKVAVAFVATTALTASTVVATVVHRDTASVPVARWMRWQVKGNATSAWDIMFRVWVSAAGER